MRNTTKEFKSASSDLSAQQDQPPAYSQYALMILTPAYVFNFIARQVIVILSGYIIEDLNLSLGMPPTEFGCIPSPEIT